MTTKKANPAVNAAQKIDTEAYVPTYKIKPELKEAVLKAIGQFPFNQIHSVMSAINVEVMDHNTLTQVINVLGNFPYQNVNGLISSISDYVEQVVEEVPAEK